MKRIVATLLWLISIVGIEGYGQEILLDRFYNYVQNQKYEEAFVLADSLKESSMEDSIAFDYYYILGSLLYHTNNIDSSYCCFNKVIQVADRMNNFDLKYVDAMMILIDSYYKAEDYSKVAKKARSVCKKDISLNYVYISSIYKYWIQSLLQLDRYFEAISICDKALELFGKDIDECIVYNFSKYQAFEYAKLYFEADSIHAVLQQQVPASKNKEWTTFLQESYARCKMNRSIDSEKIANNDLFFALLSSHNNQDIYEVIKNNLVYYPLDFSKKEDYKNWQYNQFYLGLYYEFAKDSIDNPAELYYDITLLSKGSLDYHIGKLYPVPCSWVDVRDNLTKEELAVEFPLLGNEILILGKEYTSPISITIDSLLINQLKYYFTSENSYKLYSDESSPAFDLWALLTPYLEGIKTIYVSPSNFYNNINYEAILLKEGKRVEDYWTIKRLISTADIKESKTRNINKYHTASIYGGMDYDASVEVIKKEVQIYKHNNYEDWGLTRGLSEEERGGSFSPLEGALFESKAINDILESNNIQTSCYLGAKANEESIKNQSECSSDILHIATHGFALNGKSSNIPHLVQPFVLDTIMNSEYESSMSRSGLVFSGGNRVWQGNPSIDSIEDGILTSKEIAALDLTDTKLVVLSACESGLGDMSNFSGTVWGIQHAFRLAGVDYIMASLWRVDDTATSLLMTAFYKNLLEGEEIHVALKHAKQHLQKNGFDDPYYWASFYILD